jgi:hypothetical protein
MSPVVGTGKRRIKAVVPGAAETEPRGRSLANWGHHSSGAGPPFCELYEELPKYIPLPASAVNRIVQSVRPFGFKQVYGAWWDAVVEEDAKSAVEKSAARYLKAIGGTA